MMGSKATVLGVALLAALNAAIAAEPRVVPAPAPVQGAAAFPWPQGKHAALSLSFDDARTSQIDVGLPFLAGAGVRVTFYVQPEGLRKRLAGWKAAAAAGHEIGNHTVTHPCTGNFAFARRNALEGATLERLEREMRETNLFVSQELGRTVASFAYPCGETFVGRGEGVKSYVPLVARLFHSGRLYLSEDANDPAFCDLAQLLASGSDEVSWDGLRPIVEKAVHEGRWLVLAGHDIGDGGFQTTRLATLAALCRYAKDPANGVWIDTVDAVATHVRAFQQTHPPGSESGAARP